MEDYLLPDEGDNIIRTRDFERHFNKASLGVVFFEQMQKFRNNTAQVDSVTGLSNTYGELLQQCTRTAIKMSNRGIQEDDIVCICSHNTPNACVPYVAGLFLGAQVCALDPNLSLEDVKHLLNQVPPKIIFALQECCELINHVIHDLNLNSTLIAFESCSFEQFLESNPREKEFKPRQIDDVFKTAIIFFSSGTTGLPKGICMNHYSLLSQCETYKMMGFNLNVFFSYPSLYWTSPVGMLISSTLHGQTRVLSPKFDAEETWHIIQKYKVTTMYLSSTQGHLLLKSKKPTNTNFENLEHFGLGGSSVSTQLISGLQGVFPNAKIIQCYGCTEIAGTLTISKPNCEADMTLLKNKPGSCGRPLPGIWYKIVDIKDEVVLGPNQEGELRVKTQYQLNGYYDMDASDAWDSHGWFKTGDVCYYDEDYNFYVVDRIKELIKYRAWHISPALLEGILLKHPAVQMAIVIGVPHEEDDEHPLALVTLTNDFKNSISEEELRNFVDTQVDENKKLRAGVKIIDTMPQTPSGKVNRFFLKKRVLSQMI